MRAYVTPGTLILDNCALRLPRFWAYRVLDKHMDRVNVEVPPSAEMLLSLRPTCCALLLPSLYCGLGDKSRAYVHNEQ